MGTCLRRNSPQTDAAAICPLPPRRHTGDPSKTGVRRFMPDYKTSTYSTWQPYGREIWLDCANSTQSPLYNSWCGIYNPTSSHLLMEDDMAVLKSLTFTALPQPGTNPALDRRTRVIERLGVDFRRCQKSNRLGNQQGSHWNIEAHGSLLDFGGDLGVCARNASAKFGWWCRTIESYRRRLCRSHSKRSDYCGTLPASRQAKFGRTSV